MISLEEYSNKFYSGKDLIFECENIFIENFLSQELIARSDKNILFDFGCGSGDWLKYYKKVAHKIYATDKNNQAVDFCKKKYCQDNNITIFNYNEKSIKLQNSSIDIITIFWVFQEILDDEEFYGIIMEFNRILKKGGFIIVVDNQYSNIRESVESTKYGEKMMNKQGDIIRQFRNNTLSCLFKEFNYNIRKHEEFGMSFCELYQKT